MKLVIYTADSWWVEWSSPSWYRFPRAWVIGCQIWPKTTRIPHHVTLLGLGIFWYGKRDVKVYY